MRYIWNVEPGIIKFYDTNVEYKSDMNVEHQTV